jgi:hypothetical protein
MTGCGQMDGCSSEVVASRACRPVLDGSVDAASETYAPAVSSGKTLADKGTVLSPDSRPTRRY